MADPLSVWQGEFGEAYTDRNAVDWRVRLPAFRQMLGGLPIRRVLEVGCNRAHNLVAIAELLKDASALVGLEPNRYALKLARQASREIGVLQGQVFDLPFQDGYFDLVFTSGVLIHIALPDLPKALAEIHRASARFILAIEYFAEQEMGILYRGHNDLLWKRNFLKHYRAQFPDLSLLRHGYWDRDHAFDRTHWWLLEKPGGDRSR